MFSWSVIPFSLKTHCAPGVLLYYDHSSDTSVPAGVNSATRQIFFLLFFLLVVVHFFRVPIETALLERTGTPGDPGCRERIPGELASDARLGECTLRAILLSPSFFQAQRISALTKLFTSRCYRKRFHRQKCFAQCVT